MITSSTTSWSPFSTGEGLLKHIRSKFWKFQRIDGGDFVSRWIQKIKPSITVEDWDLPVDIDEMLAHVLREPVIAVILAGMLEKQVVIDVQKLFSILVCYLSQVADHPTNLFKIPVVS